MTGNSPYTLAITGDAGLRNVQDIAVLLRQAVADHGAVTVVTNELTSIDLTIVQLLVAARKSALAAGNTLTLRAPQDGVLHRLLIQAGLIGADGTPKTQEGDFWTAAATLEQAA